MKTKRIKNRKFQFRGRVVKNDPMTNPKDGWVVGFYYQDLCLDIKGSPVMKSFIRSGEMIWEVDTETVGKFMGYDNQENEVFEGDILRMYPGNVLAVLEWDEENCEYTKHLYIRDEVNSTVVDGGRVQLSAGEKISSARKTGNIFDNIEIIRAI